MNDDFESSIRYEIVNKSGRIVATHYDPEIAAAELHQAQSLDNVDSGYFIRKVTEEPLAPDEFISLD